MKELNVRAASGRCRVFIGRDLKDLEQLVKNAGKLAVLDENVAKLHSAKLPEWPKKEVKAGENHKNLKSVEALYQSFLEQGLERESFITAIGGGTVCDMAAFAACTYMRGIAFGLAPTTLLAQADAGIGGKNGVNFGGLKNIVGVIKQPDFVLCDPTVLGTLPAAEIRNGLAEIIKTAVIGDRKLFNFLEENLENALALEPAALESIITKTIQVKAKIIERDETEKGERIKLNFGHTLGHAIESVHRVPHGQAVSIGMSVDLRLSQAKQGLPPEESNRVLEVLKACGLPVELELDKASLMHALTRDKKKHGECLHLALLKSIGQVEITVVPVEDFLAALS